MCRFLIVVAASLVVAGTGAVETQARADSTLRVAAFQSDVTPAVDGHPLIWVVPVKTVEDPLLAKGIVVERGDARYVLCAVDWCGLCNSSHDLFREKIAAAAKTDVARVTVHCVHQHTAPYTDGDAQRLLNQYENPPTYVDFEFLEEVTDRLAGKVAEALGTLEPFDQVGIGQANVERVASSRRIPRGDGKITGRMSSTTDPRLQALPEGGPAKILHLPGECMIEFQLYTQSLQPGEFVAVAAYGDLGPGYIRTEESFSEGGYEPSASRTGKKCEHVLKTAIRELLNRE